MSDQFMTGAALALMSLIFSSHPFIQLVYVLACTQCVIWDDFYIITGIFVISIVGAEINKRLKG